MRRTIFAELHMVKRIHAARVGGSKCANLLPEMDEDQETLRELIRRMAEVSQMDYTALARKAHLAPSTVTRFMNGDPKHLMSLRTIFKLIRASGVTFAGLPDRPTAAAVGDRMLKVRQAIAPEVPDDQLAVAFGWSEKEMQEIFAGRQEPRLSQLSTFAARLKVTTDFLLTGMTDGLPHAAERTLYDAFPDLFRFQADIEPRTDTGPASHKKGRRR